MCQERIIFSLIKDNEIVTDFVESLKESDFVKEILKNDKTSLKERIVSSEYYQELVDEGGQLNYSQSKK